MKVEEGVVSFVGVTTLTLSNILGAIVSVEPPVEVSVSVESPVEVSVAVEEPPPPSLLLLHETKAQCVLAIRLLHGDPAFHYAINYIGVKSLTAIVNVLYGQKLTDIAKAIKMFHGNFVRGIKLSRNGFNLDFELVCRKSYVEEKLLKYQPNISIEP